MKNRTKRLWLNFASTAIIILTAVFSFFAIIALSLNIVFVKTYVRGYSMQPTLNLNIESSNIDGDLIYINKFKNFSNDDIVVANVAWFSDPIIKRLIGKPGDIIEIKDQAEHFELIVNNNLLYSREKTNISSHGKAGGTIEYYQIYLNFINNHPNNVYEKEDGTKCIKLNANEYFLMGDNWAESTDCMVHGPVKEKDIIGKVDLVIPKGENKFLTLTKFIFTEILF